MPTFSPLAVDEQRAAVVHGPHDLRVETRPRPIPEAGEALVKVSAVGICGSDIGYLNGHSKYVVKAPFVLGHEASGVIVALGPRGGDGDEKNDGAMELTVGTRVALVPGSACGYCDACLAGHDNLCESAQYLGSAASDPHVDGAMQEYVCLPLARLLPVPATVSDSAAALLEPLAVAEHAVRQGDVAGSNVLVVGGGAIGQLVALAARAAGAARITVCEMQPRRRALARTHGADDAVEPAELEGRIDSGTRFDTVLDATGNPVVLQTALRATRPGGGRLIIVGNLPEGTCLPAETVRQAEIWVTATFRFPHGLDRALALVASGLDLDWLVDRRATFDDLQNALDAAALGEAPLKIHVAPTSGEDHHQETHDRKAFQK